jgi:hypothetical protein
MLLQSAHVGWAAAVLISVALVGTILHAILFAGVGAATWYFAQRTPPASIVQFIVGRAGGLVGPVGFSAVVAFLAMLLGNLLAFTNRLANVAATMLVFAAIYGGIVYALTTLPIAGTLTDLIFF